VEAPRFILWREQDRKYLLLVVLLTVLLGLVVGVFFVAFTSARVDGTSMAPTLLPADRVLITRSYQRPQVGDIVSADIQTDTGPDSVIKRVIALPGDEVRISGDIAYVNGMVSTAASGAIVIAERPDLDPITVPEGHVYLMGDNRPVSYDSRFIGPVALSSVTGRVVVVFSPLTRWTIVD
jgi:signal peptidase I